MEMSYSICMMKRLTTITTTAAAVATVFRRTTTASIFTPPSLLRRRSVAVHSQTLRHQCSSTSSSSGGVDEAQEKILVKGMRYDEFENAAFGLIPVDIMIPALGRIVVALESDYTIPSDIR
ncbi:hypothetical protein Tco_0707002 [Tanacetum coccineum]|uniref:Uncharacterized protein n=1 Tax=Tanacetum coccineum TaxID=301880 RepID=A0ABQ4YAK2_9ASTR